MNREPKDYKHFPFCVVTLNDQHTKPRFKNKLVQVKFKECMCTELCLKLWFESDWYFYNIAESG